jgi:hypothetical protein
MTDRRVNKWAGWVDGKVKHEILSMHLERDIWTKFAEMLRTNPSLPESYFWGFLTNNYITAQASAIRRQADAHPDVASLGRLLEELHDDPGRLTRTWWIDEWAGNDDWERDQAEHHWREHYGGSVSEHFDPSIAARDKTELAQVASAVKRYVDRHVAHSDTRPVPADGLPTLGEMHEVIGTIGEIYHRYYTLLFPGHSWGTLIPALQHDWQAIFRIPWESSDHGDQRGRRDAVGH